MPLVMGKPWVGGFFGSAEVSIQATANLQDRIVAAATIWVQDDGSDSDAGTEAAPYATLTKAISVAVPGDVIEMRKSGTGTWTYNAYTTFNVDGAINDEITLRVRAGDRVNFYPTAVSSGAVWHMSGCAWWIFDGSVGQIFVGDISHWSGTGGGTDTYPYNASLRGQSSAHHLKFDSIQFSGSDGFGAMEIDSTTHHWYFLDCSGKRHGFIKESGVDTGYANRDGLQLAGNNHLVVNWDGGHAFGGHNLAHFLGHECVVRGSAFNQNYSDFTGLPGTGYRALSIFPETSSPPYRGSLFPWGPFLFEDNIIKNAGYTVEGNGKGGSFKMSARRLIMRYNYIFDNNDPQCEVVEDSLPAPTQDNAIEYMRSYHNTYDNNVNWHYTPAGSGSPTSDNNQDCRRFNNIISDMTESVFRTPIFSTASFVTLRNVNRWNLQGYPDKWLGDTYKGNMIEGTGTHVRLSASGDNARTADLADAIATWPNVWDSSNNTNAPTYVNSALKTKAGFALDTGSNGIDEAVEMTTVTANSSGTTITLEDAWWVYDGFDLSYYGEVGQYLAFYDSDGTSNERIRQVLTVDSQTGITLTASVTVATGDKVFSVLNDGTTVVRNMGASQ